MRAGRSPAGTTSTRPAISATPTGTFIRNTHSQPGPVVNAPPAIVPTVAAVPPTAPKMPRARLRAGPSANVVVRIARAAGETERATHTLDHAARDEHAQ